MKCFYHKADLDGHCAGAIVKSFNPNAEMIGIDYPNRFPIETIKPNETVYLVDYSVPPETLIKLSKTNKIVWIDHHVSAISAWKEFYLSNEVNEKNITVSLDITKAACELVWEYFTQEETPLIVKLIGRHDVWDHSNEQTLPFHYGMKFKYDWNVNSPIWKEGLSLQNVDEIVTLGKLIKEISDKENEAYAKSYAYEANLNYVERTGNKLELKTVKAICLNVGHGSSLRFKSVFDPKKHDIMLCYVIAPGGVKCSIYTTKEDIDCSLIAKAFGGGGHKKAAGFQTKELPF